MQNTINSTQSWYTQFWPWFLILLPASVVVASMFTIFLATKDADSLVVDDYYKKAMQINRDLRKIEFAKKIGLKGELSFKGKQLELNVNVKQNTIALSPSLRLLFIHPTKASKDFEMILVQSQNEHIKNTNGLISASYKSQLESKSIDLLAASAWYIQLIPLDKNWQLNGKLKDNNKIIVLSAD